MHHRSGAVEDTTYGLIGCARRLATEIGGAVGISAVVVGGDEVDPDELKKLGHYGVDRVLRIESPDSGRYNGEIYADRVATAVQREAPLFFLMAHTEETADLACRVACVLETGLVTMAMDIRYHSYDDVTAVRPADNGFLFEELRYRGGPPFMATLLPSVLSSPRSDIPADAEIVPVLLPEGRPATQTEVLRVLEADPGELDIDEADIIVAAGRGAVEGASQEDSLQKIHELASYIGGSVAGTRPVIDMHLLPFDRQIGQTGKTVAPQLCINIGISGANEYTAGMEKSKKIIAVNPDPKARIFRFADLGLVGDAHEILPLLISRLHEIRNNNA